MAVVNGETGEWKTLHGVRVFIPDKLNSTEKDFKQKAKAMYQNGKELFKQDTTTLKDIDWDNPAEVENKAIQLVQKFSPKEPACFRVAGMLAAMFEHKHIPYEVHIGECVPAKRFEKIINISNHIWIKNTKNDKIYEHFVGYKTENLISHKSNHMIRLTKDRPILKKGVRNG